MPTSECCIVFLSGSYFPGFPFRPIFFFERRKISCERTIQLRQNRFYYVRGLEGSKQATPERKQAATSVNSITRHWPGSFCNIASQTTSKQEATINFLGEERGNELAESSAFFVSKTMKQQQQQRSKEEANKPDPGAQRHTCPSRTKNRQKTEDVN